MTEPEYWDIEHHEDEGFTVAQLGKIRAIGRVLNLDILSIFGIGCQFCANDISVLKQLFPPRNELISQRRMSLGLTRNQLGDRIGFETVAVEQMERDPDFLEQLSVELIGELAGVLELPVHALLRVPCLKCGAFR
jgi:DNA-binding XRE family transcriptional regulator